MISDLTRVAALALERLLSIKPKTAEQKEHERELRAMRIREKARALDLEATRLENLADRNQNNDPRWSNRARKKARRLRVQAGKLYKRAGRVYE